MSSIEDQVIAEIEDRALLGLNKYGVTMDRKDLSKVQWLQNLKEELMDAIVYIQKLINIENGEL